MHAQPSSKQSTVCSFCEQDFPSYYSLQLHRIKDYGTRKWKPSDTVVDLYKIVEEEREDGEKRGRKGRRNLVLFTFFGGYGDGKWET